MESKDGLLSSPSPKHEEDTDMAALVSAPPAAPHTLGGGAAKRSGGAYRPTPAKTFQCRGFGDCRMVFSRSEHLARHIRKHTGERPFACHCSKQFSRLDNLRQHAQTVHADKAEENEAMMRDLTSLHATMIASHKTGRRRNPAKARPGTATGTEGVAHNPHSPTSPTFDSPVDARNRHSFAAPSPTSPNASAASPSAQPNSFLGPHSVPSTHPNASRSATNKSFLGPESAAAETQYDQSFLQQRPVAPIEPASHAESVSESISSREDDNAVHTFQQPFRKPATATQFSSNTTNSTFRPSTTTGVESRLGSTFRFGPTSTSFGQTSTTTSHRYFDSEAPATTAVSTFGNDDTTGLFRFEVPDPGSRPQTSSGAGGWELPPLSSIVSRVALTSRPPTASGDDLASSAMDVSSTSRPSTSTGTTLARAAEQRVLPLPTPSSRPGTSTGPDYDGGFAAGRGFGFGHRPGERGMAPGASDGSGYGSGFSTGRRDVRMGRPTSASVSFLLDRPSTSSHGHRGRDGPEDVDMDDSPFSFNVGGREATAVTTSHVNPNPRKRPLDDDSTPFGFNLYESTDERPRSRRRSSGPVPSSSITAGDGGRPTTSSGFGFSYLSLGSRDSGEGAISTRAGASAAPTAVRSEGDERRNGSSPISSSGLGGIVISGWKPSTTSPSSSTSSFNPTASYVSPSTSPSPVGSRRSPSSASPSTTAALLTTSAYVRMDASASADAAAASVSTTGSASGGWSGVSSGRERVLTKLRGPAVSGWSGGE